MHVGKVINGRWLGLLCTLVLGAFILFVPDSRPAQAAAGINQQINFQGRLLNSQGVTVPDGYYNVQFKIYQDGDGQSTGNATGSPAGSLKWTEEHLNNTSTAVQVRNGYFSVQLGSVTAFGSNIDWNQDTLWLSINIGNTNASCTPFSNCSPDGEMLPMKRLAANPYALNSRLLGGLTSSQFIQLGQGVQGDSTNNSSIYVNKTGTGNLLQLQASGADVFTLSNSGDISFGANADHTISVATAGAGVAGKSLTISAGGAGSGGSTLAGGSLVLQGGAGGGTNGNGGNVNINAGAKNGSGNDGIISIGTTIASAINIGKSGITTALTGTLNASGPIQIGGTQIIDTSRNLSNIGTISSGTINSQTISSSANFTGTLAVQGANITIGNGSNMGSLRLGNSTSGRLVVIQGLNPSGSGDATVQVPSIAGGSTDTFCLQSVNNCNHAITSGGTQNYVTKYTNAGGTQIGNSSIFNDATGVSIGNSNPVGLLNVGATNQFQVSSTGAVTAVGVNSGTGLIQGTGGLTVAGTTTLSSLNSAGILHTNSSGVVSTSAVVLGTDTSGSYVANLGTLTGLTTSGNSGAGSTPTLSVTYGSTANTAVQGDTTLTCPSGTGNLSGGGNQITLGNGGSCNDISIINNPTFSGLITASGGLSVANATTFTNAGATLNTAVAISNKPTGGDIATAATIEGATGFTVNQTTAGQTLSLPNPSTVTTAGRIVYVSNIGSVNFSMHNATIPAGESRSFIWNGTAWTRVDNVFVGAGLSQIGNVVSTSAPTSVSNDTNIQGSIGSNTLTLSWAGTLAVARGGTGAGSFTANGILFGNGTGALQVTSAAANSVLVTDGSNVPSLSQTLPTAVQGNITSTGALASGSIASGFGTISTGNNITTTAALQGGTLSINSGALSVDGSGNVSTSGTYNSNTFTSTGLTFGATSTATIQSAASQALNITGNAASTISTTSGSLTLQGGNNTVSLGNSNNLEFNGTTNSTIKIASATTANTAGYNLTVAAGTANGSTTGNTGGQLILQGGAAAGSGNNNGGDVLIQGGAATGSGTAGGVIIKPAANSATALQIQKADGTPIMIFNTSTPKISVRASLSMYDQDQTLSGTNLDGIKWTNTYTLQSFGGFGAAFAPAVDFNPTIKFNETGNVLFSTSAMLYRPTIVNDTSQSGIGFGNMIGFGALGTIKADTTTINGSTTSTDFASQTGFSVQNGGSLSFTTARSFNSALAVGSGVTITNLSGMQVSPTVSNGGTATNIYGLQFSPTVSNGGTGTNITGIMIQNPGGTGSITSNIGIDIAALGRTGMTTNIGLRIAEPTHGTTRAALQLTSTSGANYGGINFAGDTFLYRTSVAGILKTDGSLVAGTSLLAPILDVDTVATLGVGTANASTVNVGGTTNTTTVTLQGATSANYNIGTTSGTGTITVGRSTASNTINLGSAVGNAATQTINIGTSSTSGSATNINIGSTIAGTTVIHGPGGITLSDNTSIASGKALILGNNNGALTCNNGAIYYDSGVHRFKGCENGAWTNLDNYADLQTYTSGNNTWTKPSNVTAVQVILVGGGGGGGGAAARNGGQERDGGGGGGGGAYVSQVFAAADLASTANASVGSAGTSGTGAASSGSNGASGGAGGTSCFSTTSSCGGTIYAQAFGGGGGGGGGSAQSGGGGGGGGTAATGSTATALAATAGTGGNPLGAAVNSNSAGGSGAGGGNGGSAGGSAGTAGGSAEYGGGGGGGSSTSNLAAGAGGSSLHGAGGGGGGGPVNSGNATGTSAAGGASLSYGSGGGGTAGTGGVACGSGGTGGTGANGSSIKAGAGGGGGGPQGGNGATGCPGGPGGAPGGGGGGGGAGGSGGGGAGGTGGSGQIWIISW